MRYVITNNRERPGTFSDFKDVYQVKLYTEEGTQIGDTIKVFDADLAGALQLCTSLNRALAGKSLLKESAAKSDT